MPTLTEKPRREECVGFVELAEALGVEPWDVADLVEEGKIPFYQQSKGCGRLIRRTDANRYLRKVGRPPVPATCFREDR